MTSEPVAATMYMAVSGPSVHEYAMERLTVLFRPLLVYEPCIVLGEIKHVPNDGEPLWARWKGASRFGPLVQEG